MRKIVVTTFLTLDGVMEAPGGGDHPHAGWTFTDVPFDEEAYEIKEREQRECSAILMGRVTYDEFAPVWHTMGEFASYNEGEKYVVSTTLEGGTAPWGDFEPVRVLRSVADVAALKEEGEEEGEGEQGPILVHGSAQLAQSLAAAGLVDRYHLLVFPVLLGTGKRLFGEGPKVNLTVDEARTYANGITKLTFDVAR